MVKFRKYYARCRRELCESLLLAADVRMRRPLRAKPDGGVLVVRVDGIGDYMLFRQALRALRFVPRFAGKKITLCGNAAWKELAEALDPDSFDAFLPVDRHAFMKNRSYRHALMDSVRAGKFSIALQPTYSRDYIGDSLVCASSAPVRIGFAGPVSNSSYIAWRTFTSNYTELIPPAPGRPFELDRNKEVLTYLGVPEDAIPSFQDVLPLEVIQNARPHVQALLGFPVFFLGGSEKSKRWPAVSFSRLVPYVYELYGSPVVLLGGPEVRSAGTRIAEEYPERVINAIENTTLAELALLVARAPLLISNDSAAAHMSATYGTPGVVLSNGSHVGRFHPYPKCLASHLCVLLPPEFGEKERNKYYNKPCHYSVNSIAVEAVEKVIRELHTGRG